MVSVRIAAETSCGMLLPLLLLGAVAALPAEDESRFALPDDLLIGAGTAAVQAEGAWDEGGKGVSALDFALHTGKAVPMGFLKGNEHLSDKAADSYHRYKEDLAAASQLKLQMYKMSISWARLFPDGNISNPNHEGVEHYHQVLDEVLKYKMTPVVTMYHFDHPQVFEEEFGGWLDRKMVDRFKEYAAFLLKEYSSQVKLWTTMNEPNIYCSFIESILLYGRDMNPDQDVYHCLHYFLLGHAEAYRVFREGKYEGQMGFIVTTLISQPTSTRPEDIYASDVFNQMFTGILLHPLVYGDYPQVVKNVAGDKLPEFSEEERQLLKKSTDYIGLNAYYSMLVAYRSPETPRRNVGVPLQKLLDDANFLEVGYRSPTGESLDDLPQNMIAPDAMRTVLLWTWQSYKLPIMITENGIGTPDMPGLHDQRRAEFYSAFMRSMVCTIHDFGVKVIAYSAWSLIDSWEWRKGFQRPFGLVHVDYAGGSLNRTLKDSASFWLELAERRVVPLVVPSSSAGPALSLALLLLPAAVLAWQR